MWIEILFYMAFFSQILLISYHYPKKIVQRMDYIFEHFPIDQYSKLYPKGYEKTLEGKFIFKWLNLACLLLGLIVFVIFVIANQQENIGLEDVNFLPFLFGFLQAIPFLYLEFSGYKQLKLMRNLNVETKRRAELSPRNVFNYISPIRLISAISMLIICVLVMFTLSDFQITASLAVLLGSMFLCNALFVGLGYKILHGKKLDPHQSPEDRHTMACTAFRSYTSVSMLVSVFFIFNQSIEHYGLEAWEPIFNCLYWQGVVLLSTGTLLKMTKLTAVNYDVYKTPSQDLT